MRKQKKGDSPSCGKTPFLINSQLAYYGNVNRSRTFLALLNIESNLFAFIQSFEAACVNSGIMDKNIGSIFLLNKTVPFATIKPFDYSIRHCATSFTLDSLGSKLQVATLTNGCFLQNETAAS
jgi:hypothetical protein